MDGRPKFFDIIIMKAIQNILSYGKWIVVKISPCPKYVIISRSDDFGR